MTVGFLMENTKYGILFQEMSLRTRRETSLLLMPKSNYCIINRSPVLPLSRYSAPAVIVVVVVPFGHVQEKPFGHVQEKPFGHVREKPFSHVQEKRGAEGVRETERVFFLLRFPP